MLASTSTNICTDTYNVQHNSSISVCENEFSNTFDTEIFDEVVSYNDILNDLSLISNENYLDENNSLKNSICIINTIIYIITYSLIILF